MANYVVSYDQHRDRDYTPVWNQLHAWGAQRVLESLWLLSSNLNAIQVRDTLTRVTSNRDSIAVIELNAGANWAAYAVQPAGLAWLKQNIAA